MSLSAVAAIILVAGGLIAAILGVAELSPGAMVGGLVVIVVGLVVGVVSGRRYERDRRR